MSDVASELGLVRRQANESGSKQEVKEEKNLAIDGSSVNQQKSHLSSHDHEGVQEIQTGNTQEVEYIVMLLNL